MRLSIPQAMAAVAIILCAAALCQATALGQEIVTVSATDTTENTELSELQARLATLEAQLQQGMTSGYEAAVVQGAHQTGAMHGGHAQPSGGCGCNQCTPCSTCGCEPCGCHERRRQHGPYIEGEFVYLKPHNSGGTGVSALALGVDPLVSLAIDPDFEPTARYAAGWQLADGFGVRGRFWEFDHDADEEATLDAGTEIGGEILAADTTVSIFHDWDLYYIDLEVFDSTDFGGWAITWSAGVRYISYQEERGLTPVEGTSVDFVQTKSIDDFGLTSSVEFRRKVLHCLGVFANARASFLMGDEENTLDLVVGGVTVASIEEEQSNDIKYIYEAQFGAEYTTPLGGGSFIFARVGLEMQFWDNFGNAALITSDESTGFAGAFAAAGLMR
jgi:hypothetical protein